MKKKIRNTRNNKMSEKRGRSIAKGKNEERKKDGRKRIHPVHLYLSKVAATFKLPSSC